MDDDFIDPELQQELFAPQTMQGSQMQLNQTATTNMFASLNANPNSSKVQMS